MRIAIVGLGVVGGSFALALGQAGGHEVYGVDTDAATLDKALAMGMIQKGSRRAADILPLADLTILAVYPHAVKPFLAANGSYIRPGAVLTDVTGVKSALLHDREHWLPPGVDFIMGHPMAGREKRGIDYASAQVLQGANYLLTPLPANREENLRMLEQLALSLGFGRVWRLSPQEHDAVVAFTSQLPHALAVALVNSDAPQRETGRFVGDSFRELTRIANINGELWSELFLENRGNLLAAIKDFSRELAHIQDALERCDKQKLLDRFDLSSRRRAQLEK